MESSTESMGPGGAQRRVRLILYECDRCGLRMTADDSRRFIVKIESYAGAGPLEDSEHLSVQDHSTEIRSIICQLQASDPLEIENQTYRKFHFDLCRDCNRDYLRDPIPKNPQ